MNKKRYAVQVVREIRIIQSVIVDATEDEEPSDLAIAAVQEKPLGALIESDWDYLGHDDTAASVLNDWGHTPVVEGCIFCGG